MSTPPPSLFGIVLPSRSVLVTPTAVISPTQYAFTFPAAPAFGHLAVFLLPGTTLPPTTLAGIYIQLPQPAGGPQQFTLLGALANEKSSAIFQIGGASGGGDTQIPNGPANGDGIGSSAEDEMVDVQNAPVTNGSSAPIPPPQGNIIVGISIEPAAALNAQLAALRPPPSSSQSPSSTLILATNHRNPPPSAIIPTKILAQRIIKNAFNFLASFAGSTNAGGEEVVPLRSFRDWWVKFERRVENDPGFLERDGDG
ncbi:hypothetical protein MMC29_003579 [Sticta canariensis]|nr:hypothetical protein [Sticta canariensis]